MFKRMKNDARGIVAIEAVFMSIAFCIISIITNSHYDTGNSHIDIKDIKT